MQSARGIVRTVGFAIAVAGLPPLALALEWLTIPADELPLPLWSLGCGGATLVFAGLSLLVPDSLPRPRGLLAALAVTGLAALFDWIGFGGARGGWALLLDSILNSLAMKQNAAMNVVVLFAVLLTLLALYAWLQWFRSFTEKTGTPLKAGGRKGKARESVE